MSEARRRRALAVGVDAEVPRRGHLEEAQHSGGFVGVGLDGPVFEDVPVTHRGVRRPEALLRLFVETLHDLLGEVVDVVLRHQHLDAVDELLVGAGALGENLALLHQVNLQPHLLEVERDVVVEVPVETVGLLDQHGAHLGMLVEEREHLLEGTPPRVLRGLRFLEDAGDPEPFLGGVLFEELQLCRDGEPVRLVLAAHARINDGEWSRRSSLPGVLLHWVRMRVRRRSRSKSTLPQRPRPYRSARGQ